MSFPGSSRKTQLHCFYANSGYFHSGLWSAHSRSDWFFGLWWQLTGGGQLERVWVQVVVWGVFPLWVIMLVLVALGQSVSVPGGALAACPSP